MITKSYLDQFGNFKNIFMYWYSHMITNFPLKVFIIMLNTIVNVCTQLNMGRLHFDCLMIHFVVFVNYYIQGLFQNDKVCGDWMLRWQVSFLKRSFFLNLNWKCQKQFSMRGIRPPPTLLDYSSVLLSNKGPLIYKRRTLFQE